MISFQYLSVYDIPNRSHMAIERYDAGNFWKVYQRKGFLIFSDQKGK